MTRLMKVLVASFCVMLAASVVCAVIAVIFHPAKSETAIRLKKLQFDVNCAVCRANQDQTSTSCEKCDSKQNKNNDADEGECKIDEVKRKELQQVIQTQMKPDPLQRLKKTLQLVNDPRKEQKIINDISKLNLNVPRPSAHWYLNDPKESVKAAASSINSSEISKINVSTWETKTGSKTAHTKNGIKLQEHDGLMMFSIPGWYHIYFQMDFHSSEVQEKSYKVKVFVSSGMSNEEKNYFMIRDEMRSCSHNDKPRHYRPKTHSCVVLGGSGTFKIEKDEKIRVQVEMPTGAYLNTDSSRSYLGALYLRHTD